MARAMYCTTDDVKNVARSFKISFDQNAITTGDLETLIEEASERLRYTLQPHYALSTVEGLGTVPYALSYAAALQATILLATRWDGADAADFKVKAEEIVAPNLEFWIKAIGAGLLLDDGQAEVTPQLTESLQSPAVDDALGELYADGTRLRV